MVGIVRYNEIHRLPTAMSIYALIVDNGRTKRPFILHLTLLLIPVSSPNNPPHHLIHNLQNPLTPLPRSQPPLPLLHLTNLNPILNPNLIPLISLHQPPNMSLHLTVDTTLGAERDYC